LKQDLEEEEEEEEGEETKVKRDLEQVSSIGSSLSGPIARSELFLERTAEEIRSGRSPGLLSRVQRAP